ncbi:hypothetical protein RI367_004138 [Sorochytrium milnesiophthora]
MHPTTLTVRRKVHPLESIPVKVPEFRLTFQAPGFPYVEPAFASIERIAERKQPSRDKAEPECVHGVAYKITQSDYDRIRDTEMGNGHPGLGYDDEVVECVVLQAVENRKAGDKLQARALTLPKHMRHDQLLPSYRYWKMLCDGAARHDLPDHYQQWMRSLPHYKPNSTRQNLGRYASLLLGMPVIIAMAAMYLMQRYWRTKVPYAVPKFTRMYSSVMWTVHDYCTQHIFGNGGTAVVVEAVADASATVAQTAQEIAQQVTQKATSAKVKRAGGRKQ